MKLIGIGLALITLVGLFSCARKAEPKVAAGGVYSIKSGGGEFGVAKVLVLDGETIHIRLYKNRFPTRPKSIDQTALTLGTVHDADGKFGIGHLPIRTAEFVAWQPQLLVMTTVSTNELDGYEEWKQAGGGVWGK